MATAVLCLVLFSAGTLPWKLHNYRHHGAYSLTIRDAWMLYWEPPEVLPTFVRAGNTACVLDLTFCKFVNRHKVRLAPRAQTLLLAAFLSDPGRWIGHRISEVNWLWFGRPWKPPPDASWRDYAIYVEGVLYLAVLFLSVWLLLSGLRHVDSGRLQGAFLLHGAIIALFVAAHAMVFVVIHYEHRYSLPLRIFCLWSLGIVLTLRCAAAGAQRGRLTA
jgi:hypothetical protein